MSHLIWPYARQKRDRQKLHAASFYARLWSKAKAFPGRVLRSIKLAVRNARQLNALSQLSDHQLKDIGLSRHEINSQLNPGFFNLPPSHHSKVEYQHFGTRESIYPVIRPK